MKRVFLLAIFMVFISSAVFAESSSYILCKNGTVVRMLRVIETEDSGCITKYTKRGVEKVIARGLARASCEKIMMNVKSTLEKGWFQCRDIHGVKVYGPSSEEMTP